MLIHITDDLYDIAARLRSIDEGYELYYDPARARYEVHGRGALQFVVPFDELDARTVEYAMQTRIARAEQLFEEVERNNAERDREQLRLAAQRAQLYALNKEKQ